LASVHLTMNKNIFDDDINLVGQTHCNRSQYVFTDIAVIKEEDQSLRRVISSSEPMEAPSTPARAPSAMEAPPTPERAPSAMEAPSTPERAPSAMEAPSTPATPTAWRAEEILEKIRWT
jgi:hypothetical protein